MLSRNLIADKDELILRLRAVNYYRLTGYLAPFRESITREDGSLVKGENYRPGTTLNLVWRFYLFDRRLRFLLLDAIERIEIALRTHIAHYWADSTGIINPHALRTSYNAVFEKKNRHFKLLAKMQASYERSTLDCVIHHKSKGISDVKDLPIWVVAELTTIGEMVRLFEGLKGGLRQKIAESFGFNDVRFFDSLLSLIHQARNYCAHHSRIWNVSWVQLHVNPANKSKLNWLPIVKRLPAEWNYVWDGNQNIWVQQVGATAPIISKTSTAFLLMACNVFLRQVAHTSSWHTRLLELMSSSETPYQAAIGMGLPNHWREHPLWRGAAAPRRIPACLMGLHLLQLPA